MNRKNIFSVLASISIFALAACAPAAPTVILSNDVTGGATSTTSSSSSGSTSTLACSGGVQSASLTPEETEGPYFTANSPERASLLENGMAGTQLVITGYVYSADCKPIVNAMLDFWQADANGNYDNSGYTLRGHQFTDANGRYQLTTVVPGLYPGRTEHIHVKVQAPNGKLITTQLFFPGVTQNDSDGIYNPDLLLTIQQTSDSWQGQFNFVIPTS